MRRRRWQIFIKDLQRRGREKRKGRYVNLYASPSQNLVILYNLLYVVFVKLEYSLLYMISIMNLTSSMIPMTSETP